MGVLSRIGVALDSDLLKRFDRLIEQRGYTNRSEAFRDLIRDQLVAVQTATPNAAVVGTITLIYDHHASGITEKLTELQHAQHELVVSTSHAHLDHDSCLEVLIVHGKSVQVAQFADRLDWPQRRTARALSNDSASAHAGSMSHVRAQNQPQPLIPS